MTIYWGPLLITTIAYILLAILLTWLLTPITDQTFRTLSCVILGWILGVVAVPYCVDF